jgi:hypothetical protein
MGDLLILLPKGGNTEICKYMFPLSQLPVDMMDNDAWRMEYLRASGLFGSSLRLP